MTSSARDLSRRRSTPRLVVALLVAVLGALSLVLATSVGAGALGSQSTAGAEVRPPALAADSAPRMTVRSAGQTYVSSSSTQRPRLVMSGWTDAEGRPLNAEDNGTTRAHPVEVRIIDEESDYQASSIYPVFTDGAAEYSLPLWPFTRGMEPHTGTYRIQWRASPQGDWSTADTITLEVRLPEPTGSSTMSFISGTLFGTAWTFDQTQVIGGAFRVALTLTDAGGTDRTIHPLATFHGTYFTVSPDELQALGAPSTGGYTLSAVVPGSNQVVAVTAPSTSPTETPAPPPTPGPTVEPDPGPTSEPTVEPDPGPTPEPTDDPEQPVVPGDPGLITGQDPATSAAAPTASPRPASTAQPPAETTETAGSQEGDQVGRPQGDPAPPVQDASALDASNAGSLSGTRKGDLVTLLLPSSKAKEGDWVAVFIFPGATTNGWTQVAADHSVSIDVSGLGAGTYQIAIADRDSELLGWAQLEIAAAGTELGEGTSLLTIGNDPQEQHEAGTSDWMLLTAGGLLALGAGASLILIRPASGAHAR